MTLERVLAFNLVLAAAIASPGPALLMAVRTSLSAGGRAGIAAGAGLGCMAAAWTGMALLGLGAVFRLFPAVHTAAKVAGAACLVWLAWRMWRGSSAPVEARTPAAARLPAGLPGEPAQPEVCAVRGGGAGHGVSRRARCG